MWLPVVVHETGNSETIKINNDLDSDMEVGLLNAYQALRHDNRFAVSGTIARAAD
jgi:hypothetical protein